MRNVRLGALLAILTATFSLASGCGDDASPPNDDGAGGSDDGAGGGDAGAGGDGGDAGAGGSGGGTEQPGSVEILAEFGDVVVGGPTPMRALVRDHAGKVLGGRALSWASDTPSVATVDPETGVVTGVGEGKATISVTSQGAEASVEVQVEPAVAEPSYVALWANGECLLTRSGKLFCRDLDSKNMTGEWKPISPERRFKKLVGIHAELLTLDVDGRLYSSSRDAPEPTPKATELRFKDLAVAYTFHGAALSEDGRIYQWGYFNGTDMPFPTLVPLDEEFASVSMSESHALARTVDGRVYSWATSHCADNRDYLGVPKVGGKHSCKPTEIETGVPLTSVTAGSDVSFGLDADGVAYGWGSLHRDHPTDPHYLSIHGRGEGAEPSSTPLPLATNERFVRIVAGWKQAAAIRGDGVPFFWGWNVDGYGTTFTSFFVPTEMPDARVASLSVSLLNYGGVANKWGAFEPVGTLFLFGGPHRTYVEQAPRYLGGDAQRLTLERGGRVELALQPFTKAETLTANGFAFPSREIELAIGRDWGEPDTSGKLEHQGVSFELVPKAIRPGQAATVLVIEASDTAVLSGQQIWVGSQSRAKEWAGSATVDVWVAPPAPPPGTPLDLRCGVPESIVYGYWCLTNSGGATAPHKWKDLPLAGSTWQYENLCISYGEGGLGAARFKNPNGTVGQRAIRYGVLSKANGEPEAGAGHWLLFHEGIGDPQVEQLPFNPSTGAVGESWPFTKGGCSF